MKMQSIHLQRYPQHPQPLHKKARETLATALEALATALEALATALEALARTLEAFLLFSPRPSHQITHLKETNLVPL
jgi:hypothetical protein